MYNSIIEEIREKGLVRKEFTLNTDHTLTNLYAIFSFPDNFGKDQRLNEAMRIEKYLKKNPKPNERYGEIVAGDISFIFDILQVYTKEEDKEIVERDYQNALIYLKRKLMLVLNHYKPDIFSLGIDMEEIHNHESVDYNFEILEDLKEFVEVYPETNYKEVYRESIFVVYERV